MNFTVTHDNIVFQFQQYEKLGKNIKSLFSTTEAHIQYEQKIAKIPHHQIANLNVYEIKTLGLPPVYPYHMKIKTKGRPTTSAFSSEYEFIDQKSRRFYQTKRMGVILNLDGNDFTLTNPHFTFIENLEKLSPDIKNPGERLKLWTQVIKSSPKECILDNKKLLDFSFVKADQFCLDRTSLSKNEFKVVPELIYKEKETEGDSRISHQLPQGISKEFKEKFLNTPSIDPYIKVGNYYMQLSKPLKICLQIIKKINNEPMEKRRAFYINPMERIKKEIPEELSEDVLENIFFETDDFKSDRISHLGTWAPKLGIYIDTENKNPWFPENNIVLKIKDSLFYFAPNDMDKVIKNLEQKKQAGEDVLIYNDQAIPVQDKVISEIKDLNQKIHHEYKEIKSSSEKLEKETDPPTAEKMVAIIKDNIETKEYENTKKEEREKKRTYLKQNIPQELKDKFVKYPHQKEGLSWLQDNFITGTPGALLADDMGLGKTFQTLSFLYWYKESCKNKKPILIVAPTGLLKNWQDEHKIHLPEKNGGLGKKYKAYGELFRKDRKNSTPLLTIKTMEESDWVLTTYEAIRDHHKDFFIKISWGVIIFDEIQKTKNPNSLMTDATKALESEFSIGLTGTPIENSFIDLWCISDLLYPKILGLLKDFQKRYVKDKIGGKKIQDNFAQKKPPFILRRMKEHILKNLPKKTIIEEKIEMKKEQEQIYSEVIRKTKQKEYSSSLQALSYLKRTSLYTYDGFKGSDEEFISSNAKLIFLFKTLENIKSKNEKALISLENRNLQKKLKGICSAKWNFSVDIINGEMSGDRRKKTVDNFNQSQGFKVMIISPKAGGVGLNIVSANHIIHLERWWNPAVEDQCTDRIFRIGQKRPVFIYYPLARHPKYKEESFDIVLHHLLERKRQMRQETLSISEPNADEKNEFYRKITAGEETYSNNEESFYNSEEWKNLREKILQKYPRQCMRCGGKYDLEVDHVKPRAKYAELELDPNNLQILCGPCNLKKGAKDSPDWDFR